MTQKDCLDEILLSANQLEVSENLNVGLILTYMNWAIRKVGSDTFPYRLDWYYVRGFNIIGTPQLPLSILGGRPARIMCANPDDATINPARYCSTPNEFWFSQKDDGTTQNPEIATNSSPMYFIGDDATDFRVVTIWPTTIVAATAEFYQLPPDLKTDKTDYNTDLGVPPGYDRAVVLATLSRCYQKISETEKMVRIFKQYEGEIKGLEPAEYARKVAMRNNLRALPPVKPQPQMEAQQ